MAAAVSEGKTCHIPGAQHSGLGLHLEGAALPRPSSSNVLSIFYGYPDWLVARWCGVSVATARAWKTNRRKPSRPALRLFTLHRDGRVLGDDWTGWWVQDGYIIDPAGNRTTVAQLGHYAFIMQYAAYLASLDPNTQRAFYKLLGQP